MYLTYLICLVLGLMFTFISAIAGHIFGGVDHGGDVGAGGHAEAGFDHSGMPGISFFSPTVLASFVTAFGAFGLITQEIKATKMIWVSAPISALSAGIVALLVFWVFNTVFEKTQSSSESRIATVVGMVASIITPIPENGVGEVAYVQSGTRYTAPARSEGGKPISSGQAVRITRIIGTQFYVEPAVQTQSANQNLKA